MYTYSGLYGRDRKEEKGILMSDNKFYVPYRSIVTHVVVNGVRSKIQPSEDSIEASHRVSEEGITILEKIINRLDRWRTKWGLSGK